MKSYTKVPNEIFDKNQLSRAARFLYCDLLRYCGQDDHCFPTQNRLATDLNISIRQLRTVLKELTEAGIVCKRRTGFNRPNTYTVSKDLELNRKLNSPHLGSGLPIHNRNLVPTKNTYLKGKGKTNLKGLEKLSKTIEMLGLRNEGPYHKVRVEAVPRGES